MRLAGVSEFQLTPYPGSVIGIVALSGGTPEFRVLQQLEPADDLRATLFRLHRLPRRLADEEGKRVIQGAPVVIIQVGVDDLFGHLGRQLWLYERRLRALLKHLLQILVRGQSAADQLAEARSQQVAPALRAFPG